MPDYPVRRPLERPPSHPGELMREILEDHLKLSVAAAAQRMKISRPALYAVLGGTSAVSPEMALRFARLTGGTAELLVQMQAAHDLWQTAARLKAELASIEPVAA